MKMKHVLSAALGALTLGLVATTAQAAPVGGLGGTVVSNATDASLVEKTTFHHRRHYGWHYGYKPYYYGHYGYKPYYGYYKPHYGYHYGYDKPYYGWHKPYGWRYGYRGDY